MARVLTSNNCGLSLNPRLNINNFVTAGLSLIFQVGREMEKVAGVQNFSSLTNVIQ